MKREFTRVPSKTRENPWAVVSPIMKHLVPAFAAVTLFIVPVWAGASVGASLGAVPIEVMAGTPTLTIKNPRIDARDGKIRGTAYVNFGYAAPGAAHVHAYGLNSRGQLVAEGCDRLSGSLLSPHPRRAGKGRDAFGILLGGKPGEVRLIRLVSHVGKGDC